MLMWFSAWDKLNEVVFQIITKDNKCQKLMRTDPASISRYDICKLACETYTLALSAVNLQSAFRKTGIYPVDRNVKIIFCSLAQSMRSTEM
jgi:hypothetical protein